MSAEHALAVEPDAGIARLGAGTRPYTVGGVMFIALLLVGVAVVAWTMRVGTLSDARRVNAELGVALAEQTARSMQGVDLVLQDTINRLTARPAAGPLSDWSGRAVFELLQERLRSVPQADALSLVGPSGRVLNFTRSFPPPDIDISDRDYFRALRDDPALSSFVSAPVRNRGNDTWTVYLARRINALDGAFGGVLLGAVALHYLEDFYQSVTTKPGSTVSLFRRDGVLLAMFPHEESLIGTVPPGHVGWDAVVQAGGGSVTAFRGADGSARLASVQVLRDYPLVLEVGVSEAAALAGWRRQIGAGMVFSLLAAACMALMLRKITKQVEAHEAARTALARRNAELEEVRARLEAQAVELGQTAEALRAGERELAEQSRAMTITMETIDQGLVMVDPNGTVAAYNQRVLDLLDLPESLLARRPNYRDVLQYQRDSDEFAETSPGILALIDQGGALFGPHCYERTRPDGRTLEIRTLPIEGGGLVRTYTDITARKAADAQIHHAAHHDELTGLANRPALQLHLQQCLNGEIGGGGIALLYLDLDRFKLINDARGHEVGDRLLIEVGNRMRAMLRETDLVARIGGDEFAIVQRDVAQPESAVSLAERLVARVAEPFVINGLKLTVGASIGIAAGLDTGIGADTLRRNADIAMYQAKDAGRNTYRMYEPSMAAHQQEQFLLEQDLRAALGQQAFQLAYQPIVATTDQMVSGYEALLRWAHPTRGAVSPAEFVAVAEATGLIVPLGRWVLETACREAASWTSGCKVAVNLSPLQFRQASLVDEVLDCLARTGLPASRLELEVTEGVLLENTAAVLGAMERLRAAGVSISLDDFGTGHSSLSYLRRFPFSKIKIDKSFIRSLGHDAQSDAIVEAILVLAHRLGLLVVAEGVETPEQFEQLRRMHCPLVQGYLTGRPMPAEFARAL